MNIYRAKEMKVEPREGFALGFLAEIVAESPAERWVFPSGDSSQRQVENPLSRADPGIHDFSESCPPQMRVRSL